MVYGGVGWVADGGGTMRSTGGRGTRTMTQSKLVTFKIAASHVSLLKTVQLVNGSGDSGAADVWSCSCTSNLIQLDPLGKKSKRLVGDSRVLCEFAVREVLSEWPTLRLKLSRRAATVLEQLKASPPSNEAN